MLPVARVNELHVEQVGDDLVLFDHRTHAAHSLNATAAFVWERCDGEHSCAQIADEARQAGSPLTENDVRKTVEELSEKQLLATAAEPRAAGWRISRRTLAKTAVAALVPAIVSVASPASAIVLSDGPIRTP
ncbi:MAG: PqqD family protein [Planctomycetaceae bacterium]|nr:PqqD family protein [Planctomycetaceae bacterium]